MRTLRVLKRHQKPTPRGQISAKRGGTRKKAELLERPPLILALMLLASAPSFAGENVPGTLDRHGRALAERMCARCHAIGRSGGSPHVGAPAFRALDRRIDLDTFSTRLRTGLFSGHPDMPAFRFSREDARALTAYLRAIQGQSPNN